MKQITACMMMAAAAILNAPSTSFCRDLAPDLNKVTAIDGFAGDLFGQGAAVSGNTLLVGAPEAGVGGLGSTGAVYVFLRDSSGTWNLDAKLVASNAQGYERFGASVAIVDDQMVVGAPYAGISGAVYVFERDASGTWIEVAQKSPSGGTLDLFGAVIGLDRDRFVVGVTGEVAGGSPVGAAYIYERDLAGNWPLVATIRAGDGHSGNYFGSSVAIAQDLIVVGARNDFQLGQSAGAAYLFERDVGGLWVQVAKLTASDGAAGKRFGVSAAIQEEAVFVGESQSPGKVYLFSPHPIVGWIESAQLTASDGASGDNFGADIALDGDTLVVGAWGDDDVGSGSGSAYIFTRDLAGVWAETVKILAPDGAAGDSFGRTVALDGFRIAVGAQMDDDMGVDSGSCYVGSLHSPSIITYGSGCAGNGGIIPTYTITGNAMAGGLITLNIADAVGGSVAYIFLGLQQAAVPMGGGCFLNVAPPIAASLGPFALYPLGGSGPGVGWLSIPALLPGTLQPGFSFTSQVFILDSGVPKGFSNTNGVEVTLQ